MRAVIVGGGKVGGYLADQLVGEGHVVVVAETNERRARLLAEQSDALVIHGDGTDMDVLSGAEVDRADWLIAVTGLDEVNLVACELGITLGAGRAIARLNDPRNRGTFSALGIRVVAVTDLIGEVIERELEAGALERIMFLGRGDLSLIEVRVDDDAEPRAVQDLGLPPGTLLVAVVGDKSVQVPQGSTVLEPGSVVVAVTHLDREPEVRDVIGGRRH